jgi:ACR3 family arsenite efflux pump ArsB
MKQFFRKYKIYYIILIITLILFIILDFVIFDYNQKKIVPDYLHVLRILVITLNLTVNITMIVNTIFNQDN